MKKLITTLLAVAALSGTAMTVQAQEKCKDCCKCESCKCAPCACCKCETCKCVK